MLCFPLVFNFLGVSFRQSLWWGVGQSPNTKKTSKASAAPLYDHSTFTPLGLPDEVDMELVLDLIGAAEGAVSGFFSHRNSF